MKWKRNWNERGCESKGSAAITPLTAYLYLLLVRLCRLFKLSLLLLSLSQFQFKLSPLVCQLCPEAPIWSQRWQRRSQQTDRERAWQRENVSLSPLLLLLLYLPADHSVAAAAARQFQIKFSISLKTHIDWDQLLRESLCHISRLLLPIQLRLKLLPNFYIPIQRYKMKIYVSWYFHFVSLLTKQSQVKRVEKRTKQSEQTKQNVSPQGWIYHLKGKLGADFCFFFFFVLVLSPSFTTSSYICVE